jgi:hypothetical protein
MTRLMIQRVKRVPPMPHMSIVNPKVVLSISIKPDLLRMIGR